MDLSAIIKAVMAPLESQRTGDFFKDLQPGDKLTGKVLNLESDGRVLVDIGPSRVLAQIAFAVKPGQLLNLQVVETGPIFHFRAESPEGAFLKVPMPREDFSQVLTKSQQERFVQLAGRLMAPTGNSHQHDAVSRNALNAFSQVRTLFEVVPMERSVDQTARWIMCAVEDRGFFFEKRLAELASKPSLVSTEDNSIEGRSAPATTLINRDIKAQLMIIKDLLTQTGDRLDPALKLAPREIEFLRHSVERLLDHVVQQQERAVARWEAGQTQQVMVHLWPLQEQRVPVELKVYYPPKKGGNEKSRQHHIALLLGMDRLGLVRVDLAMISEYLHISFFVGSEALKAHFQNEIQSVKEALNGTFQQLQIDIFVSQEKIAQFHEEDTKGATAGRVDITA
jgi:predicted amino acid-binding ACT domain protein